MRLTASLALVALTPTLSGCIVWDINNNLTAINNQLTNVDNQLTNVDSQLSRVDEQLTRVDGELTTINQQLTDLRSDLEPLPQLSKLDELEAINASLGPIEKHLASLRRTIANINSTIPFLKISDDTGDEEELNPNQQPQSIPAPAGEADPAPQPETESRNDADNG